MIDRIVGEMPSSARRRRRRASRVTTTSSSSARPARTPVLEDGRVTVDTQDSGFGEGQGERLRPTADRGEGQGGSAREIQLLGCMLFSSSKYISDVAPRAMLPGMAEPDPSPTAMRDWGLAAPGELDRIVIISPHLDDSVLGCSYLMAAHPGVTVITAFAGRPAEYPNPMERWDTVCGFEYGDEVHVARRAEDARSEEHTSELQSL